MSTPPRAAPAVLGIVQASAGNVILTGGNVTIEATNASDQSANSTGVAAGGILAIGTDVANATSDVATQALLGLNAMMDLTGTLNVSATGTDENDVSSLSGSGALFAGDAATGNTNDTLDDYGERRRGISQPALSW